MSSSLAAYADTLARTQARIAADGFASIEPVARLCAEAALADRTIWLFGSGHGQFLAAELHHRAGSLACFVPMLSPVLGFAEGSAVETEAERTPGLARAIAQRYPWHRGDVLIAISQSGTTPVTVAMADHAQERGLAVVALGSRAVAARYPERRSLAASAALYLDNGAPADDALVALDPMSRVGALSTVVGAMLLQFLAIRVAELLKARGMELPVWRASALPDSDAWNDELAQAWRQRNLHL